MALELVKAIFGPVVPFVPPIFQILLAFPIRIAGNGGEWIDIIGSGLPCLSIAIARLKHGGAVCVASASTIVIKDVKSLAHVLVAFWALAGGAVIFRLVAVKFSAPPALVIAWFHKRGAMADWTAQPLGVCRIIDGLLTDAGHARSSLIISVH